MLVFPLKKCYLRWTLLNSAPDLRLQTAKSRYSVKAKLIQVSKYSHFLISKSLINLLAYMGRTSEKQDTEYRSLSVSGSDWCVARGTQGPLAFRPISPLNLLLRSYR